MGELFDDDIPIPPPRQVKDWFCSNCGQPGLQPEPGMLSSKYVAIGRCDCTKPTKRQGGVHVNYVQLVADIHWNQADFDRRQLEARMRKAYESEMRGTKLKPEQAELAARWRARLGITSNRDA